MKIINLSLISGKYCRRAFVICKLRFEFDSNDSCLRKAFEQENYYYKLSRDAEVIEGKKE